MRRGADPRLMALLVVGGACVQLPATTPAQIGGSRAPPLLRSPPLPTTRCGGCCMRAERADPGEIRASATLSAPPRSVPDVSLWTWLKGVTSGSFHDFMLAVRDAHGDVDEQSARRMIASSLPKSTRGRRPSSSFFSAIWLGRSTHSGPPGHAHGTCLLYTSPSPRD